MRREAEVHTGKQWQANTQIFSSTFHSEEARFGITRLRLGAVSRWALVAKRLPVRKTWDLLPTGRQVRQILDLNTFATGCNIATNYLQFDLTHRFMLKIKLAG